MAEHIASAVVMLVFLAIAVLFGARVWAQFSPLPKRLTVLPYQLGLRVVKGRVAGTVGPGTYWVTAKRTVLVCDARPTPFTGHHILARSADGRRLGVVFAGETTIGDAERAVLASGQLATSLANLLHQAATDAMAEFEAYALLHDPAEFRERVRERLVPPAAQLGLEVLLLQVRNVYLTEEENSPG